MAVLFSCQNKLETWLNDEFPAANYELVLSETDLEIWRTTKEKGLIEIKALQRSPLETHSCVYHFTNDVVWDLYQDQFIKELHNNWMTIE